MRSIEIFSIPENEEKTLFGNLTTIKKNIYNLQKASLLYQKEKARESYKKIILDYKKLISIVSIIVKELYLPKNIISCSLVISKLIHDGYFSNNNLFQISTSLVDVKDIAGFLGIDIVRGYGCCRHVSNIHQDIISELDLPSELLFCVLGSRVSFKESYELLNNHGAHLVNLLKYDDNFYVNDILNKEFYYFNGGFEFMPYNNECDENIIYYRPSSEIGIDKTRIEVLNTVRLLNKSNFAKRISNKEFRKVESETNYLYDSKKNLLEDISGYTKSYIKKIVNNI